ncbi:alpha-2-antiplasmin [Spea bombifrons]|uniref:alpha-2-antiplasmin n=1 Tax=Spea bombifrons TaxID=233779 RepID=UPI00234B391B|nr:alpha-2-antiplasmin [Spea bombifrons]
MEKTLIFLLIIPGIFSSAELTSGDALDTEISRTTTVCTTCNTEIPSSGVADSTSDSWSDIHPWVTTEYPTTATTTEETTTTEPSEHLENEPNKETSSEVDDQDDSKDHDDQCDENAQPEEVKKFAEAMMDFSIDLLKHADPELKKPNVVISPFSVALGLLQLSLGAGKDTEKKLLETLHVQSLKCLHNTLNNVREELKKTMKMASRIYLKKGFRIKKCFLKRSEEWYGSKTLNLARNKDDNLESINKWVREVTEGMIPKFLSDMPSDVVLMLLNAMHFKGVWKNKFDPNMTVQDVFYVSDDLTVPVDMMTAQKYPLRWFLHENLDSQVAKLSFKGNMSFVVVMPLHYQWNLSKILDNFNRTELYSRFPKEKQTFLRMPKLQLDFKLELNNALSTLGLGELFHHPDLSGISDESLFVSSVQHQSSLEVNEEGAEAAAVTAVITSRSLASYSINRPFLFFLFDDARGLPMFLGYVRNPSPGSYYKKKEFRFQDKNGKGSIPK